MSGRASTKNNTSQITSFTTGELGCIALIGPRRATATLLSRLPQILSTRDFSPYTGWIGG